MSLRLTRHKTDIGLAVHTSFLSVDGTVSLGKYTIDVRDWLDATYYILTNVDLGKEDPRTEFTDRVGRLEVQAGFASGRIRLVPRMIPPIGERG